jgi:hypothetical protein
MSLKLNCGTIMQPTKQSSKQTEERRSLQRSNPQSVVGRPGASPDQVCNSFRFAIPTSGEQDSAVSNFEFRASNFTSPGFPGRVFFTPRNA